MVKKNFTDIQAGDIVICYNQYSHDYKEHRFLVTSIEKDKENITETNPEGIVLRGADLSYPDDVEMSLSNVNEGNFCRYQETVLSKEFIASMAVGVAFIHNYDLAGSRDTRVQDWNCDEQCPTVAKHVIEKLGCDGYVLPVSFKDLMRNIVEDVISGKTAIEDHTNDDYSRGFIAGSCFQMLTNDEFWICAVQAEKEWKKDDDRSEDCFCDFCKKVLDQREQEVDGVKEDLDV